MIFMEKILTILHISDLHRSSSDPITNDELISALIGDRDRYILEDPSITKPDIIVVSGDLIQGVSLGIIDYEREIEDQYSIAEKFLDELVKRFLSGDRSRIIIIPGNHDVDWNTAKDAMLKIEDLNQYPDFGSKLYTSDSKFRWDWKSFTAYLINDQNRYAERLKAFWNFFNKFYEGVDGLLMVQSNSDVNLFSFCDGKIGVAAYNSCHGNDCFAFHGMIQREVVAKSYLDLKNLGVFDLLIAVWHHNIEGPPYSTDYMDKDIIYSMIGRGFRLGLYGHQHKAQVTPQQIWLPDRESMVIVSAGSLCAGRYDLPSGVSRQYNLLEIGKDLKSVRVHVREMSVSNLFSRGRFMELGGKSHIDLDWEPPKNFVGNVLDTNKGRTRLQIDEAEKDIKTGNAESGLKLLEKLDLSPGSYERTLFLSAAAKVNNWKEIIRITQPPTSIGELVQRVETFIQLGDFSNAKQTLDESSARLNLPDAIQHDLKKRIEIQQKIAL
jgi:predicted MPP superfamily phosphohydrolase